MLFGCTSTPSRTQPSPPTRPRRSCATTWGTASRGKSRGKQLECECNRGHRAGVEVWSPCVAVRYRHRYSRPPHHTTPHTTFPAFPEYIACVIHRITFAWNTKDRSGHHCGRWCGKPLSNHVAQLGHPLRYLTCEVWLVQALKAVTAPLPLRCYSGSLPCQSLPASNATMLSTCPCMDIHRQLGDGGPRSRAAERLPVRGSCKPLWRCSLQLQETRQMLERRGSAPTPFSPHLGIGTGDSWTLPKACSPPSSPRQLNSLRPSEVSGMRREEESEMPNKGLGRRVYPLPGQILRTCEGVLDFAAVRARGPGIATRWEESFGKKRMPCLPTTTGSYGCSQCLLYYPTNVW